MSAAVSTHTGAGPLSLMSCVRESSPPQDTDYDNEKNGGSKKRFWNPRKWFKRKNKANEDVNPNIVEIIEPKETLRSRSTSELSVSEEQTRRRSGTPMQPGLSVSHDSVFHSPHSGSELELETAQSSSSLSINHQPILPDIRYQTELSERLRLRRGRGDTSEDDEGLPRSPCCNSPTTTDGPLDKTAIKDHPTKSHSTCSEGSLLSMGSSEMDEDSFGQHSSHSSKLSLQEKKTTEPEPELELGVNNTSAPLNHSAAHHKVSVRPKRTHGAPRRKRVQQLTVTALPTTPEVNEDSSVRSLTPEVISARESITELYSSKSMSKTHMRTITESQLKCSSLPPGLAAPGSEGSKLSRSRSNAGSKSQDGFATLGEEDEHREEKKSQSVFGRIMRLSGKKRKSKEEKVKEDKSKEQKLDEVKLASATNISVSTSSKQTEFSSSNSKSIHKAQHVSARPMALPRTGAAARQRVQPNDIPASPELNYRPEEVLVMPKPSPEKSAHTSPLQIELQNRFKQKQANSLSVSPTKFSTTSIENPPPLLPKPQENSLHFSPSEVQSRLRHTRQVQSLLVTPLTSSTSSNETPPPLSPKIPESSILTSPLQMEVQNGVRQTRQANSLSATAPTSISCNETQPPLSPKLMTSPILPSSPPKSPTALCRSPPKSLLTEKSHYNKFSSTKYTEIRERCEESKSKVKIAGLSAFQQRALSHNDETDEGFKSLTDLPSDMPKCKPVVKSHSFKSIKSYGHENVENNLKFTPDNQYSKSDNEKQNVHEDTPSVANQDKTDEKEVLVQEIPENKVEDLVNIRKVNDSVDGVKNFESTAAEIKSETIVEYNGIKGNSESVDLANKFVNSDITISGPSHKAVVSVGSSHSNVTNLTSSHTISTNIEKELLQNDFCKEMTVKEQQISVTKIQVKRDTTQVTSVSKSVPEFPKFELNTVEKPTNSTITTGTTTPKIVEEHSKPKNVVMETELPLNELGRKFSKDEIEIVEKGDTEESDSPKHITTALVTITTKSTPVVSKFFKKSSDNLQQRKSSVVSINSENSIKEKPVLKVKSSSLDMVESVKHTDINNKEKSEFRADEKIELKSKTQSVNDIHEIVNNENIVLRRKSVVRQKQDDEPELMKVFARRSLKLKDGETEILAKEIVTMMEESVNNTNRSKSRDSDKENHLDSPSEEKKINIKEIPIQKEPLVETKFVETTEVTLRKATNNKAVPYQRHNSLNNTKTNELNNLKMNKQISLNERPKTENWINVKSQDIDIGRKLSQEEIITSISEKSHFINQDFASRPKNVTQRAAEWEKRAKEAQRKTTP